MTPLRGRLRSHGTSTTLDARTYTSTPPCLVDRIGTPVHPSRAGSHAVVSSPQPVIEPTPGAAPPPLGTRFELHHPLQSP